MYWLGLEQSFIKETQTYTTSSHTFDYGLSSHPAVGTHFIKTITKYQRPLRVNQCAYGVLIKINEPLGTHRFVWGSDQFERQQFASVLLLLQIQKCKKEVPTCLKDRGARICQFRWQASKHGNCGHPEMATVLFYDPEREEGRHNIKACSIFSFFLGLKAVQRSQLLLGKQDKELWKVCGSVVKHSFGIQKVPSSVPTMTT